jgi:hypothetical protein
MFWFENKYIYHNDICDQSLYILKAFNRFVHWYSMEDWYFEIF